jgi:hypothetical protein
VATPGAASSALCYYIDTVQDTPNVPSQAEMFGFKLDVNSGVIYAIVNGQPAAALSDAKTITISDFVITPSSQTIDARAFCSKTCTTNCPQVIVR